MTFLEFYDLYSIERSRSKLVIQEDTLTLGNLKIVVNYHKSVIVDTGLDDWFATYYRTEQGNCRDFTSITFDSIYNGKESITIDEDLSYAQDMIAMIIMAYHV